MKTRLTPSQSQCLIELGVDPSKASELADILSLLPKMMKYKGDPYGLNIEWDDNWAASYFNAVKFIMPNEEGTMAYESATELIDALYKLLVWLLKNHPNKIKKL